MVTVTSGCYIEHGDGSWDDDWSDGSGDFGPAGICDQMCVHLAGCGAIDEAAVDACIDGCNAEHASTPYLVETGCICVLEAGCAPLGGYDCPGAPLPGPGDTGAGGYGAGGYGGGGYSTGGNGGGGNGGNGGNGGEGGWSPGGSPCVASCECPTGQSCVDGYCEAPPAPQIPCQVDCDCPSGQVCSSGVCAGD